VESTKVLHAVRARGQKTEHTLPSLDELAENPSQARDLSRQMRSELIVRASALIASLAGPLIAEPSSAPVTEAEDELLTVEEAAMLLRRSRRWLWRHKKSLPFVRQISGKSLLCSKNDLAAWLATRRIEEAP